MTEAPRVKRNYWDSQLWEVECISSEENHFKIIQFKNYSQGKIEFREYSWAILTKGERICQMEKKNTGLKKNCLVISYT